MHMNLMYASKLHLARIPVPFRALHKLGILCTALASRQLTDGCSYILQMRLHKPCYSWDVTLHHEVAANWHCVTELCEAWQCSVTSLCISAANATTKERSGTGTVIERLHPS